MSAREFEAFLARIYVDPNVRARFQANPRSEAEKDGLSHDEYISLEKTDWVGLEIASRSFARKRQVKRQERWRNPLKNTLRKFFGAFSAWFRRR